MPSETKPLRLRKPTPKTIDHLELGAPTPSKWKHAVKVDLRKLEAYRAAYEEKLDEWHKLRRHERDLNALKASDEKSRLREKNELIALTGRAKTSSTTEEPFVAHEIWRKQTEEKQAALRAMYRVAPQHRLRKRCLAIIPVLKLVGDGKLWELITAEVLAQTNFSATSILHKVCS